MLLAVTRNKPSKRRRYFLRSCYIHLSTKDQSVPDSCKEDLQNTLEQLESRQIRGSFPLYSSLLGQCNAAKCLDQARRAHALIVRDGYNSELVINNLVVKALASCGGLDDAKILFARMRPRNVFSYNIMAGALAQNGHLLDAKHLFDRMPGRTDVSYTAMLSAFSGSGDVAQAREIFDQIPEKDRITWNAMITANAQAGHCIEALDMLKAMDLAGLKPDSITFISSINCCASVGCRPTGYQLHHDVVALGLMAHVSVATACVGMYGKFGQLDAAVGIFDQMPLKNVVSWTTMLAAYAQNGQLDRATTIFDQAPCRNDVTWNAMVAAFVQSGQLCDARDVFDSMPMQNASSWNTLITAFGQSGDVDQAVDLFDRMPLPNLISWNSIIAANAQNGCGEASIKLLMRMDLEGIRPNRLTLLAVIDASSNIGSIELGSMIHSIVDETEFRHHFTIATALVAMFARCQQLEKAKSVFDQADQYDVKLSNSMIYAFTQAGHLDQAREMFAKMEIKNTVTWNLMITMNVQNGLIDEAEKLFSTMPDKDVVSGNTMMLGYAQALDLERAKFVFDRIEPKNLVSWNTMILAFAQNARYKEAYQLFRKLNQDGFDANNFTFVGALEALLGISSLRETRRIHALIAESGFVSDVSVATGLVNLYGKCGSVTEASKVFHTMPSKSMISWNAMITAFAHNGFNSSALTYFDLMQQHGFVPDAITFVTAISACSHAGLVESARGYFVSMQEDYRIDPNGEHFGCLIDLLGRAGRLESGLQC